MKIFVITISNKNENYEKLLTEKYKKLISNFYDLNFINIGFKKDKKNKNIYKEEYQKAISLIKSNSIVVALDELGKTYKSVDFSKKMKFWLENSSNIYFFVGGPDGLSEEVLNRADYVFSLSNLTFPHALAKTILIEQIYRAICIMNNHPYHRS